MSRWLLVLLLGGCSSESSSPAIDGGVHDGSVTDADLACPDAEPNAGEACLGERSCTYRCGCGWLSTATCRDGVWKTSFCPPPEEICRDGGTG
jgi:hypothetical protein